MFRFQPIPAGKFSVLAPCAALLSLIVLAPGIPTVLAAPDESKPTTSSGAIKSSIVKRKTKKATLTRDLKSGTTVRVPPKKIKKYVLKNGQMVLVPDASSESSTPEPTPTPRVATGRRVKISARLVVTNSDDGYQAGSGFIPVPEADKRVELHGTISFGGQTAFSFTKKGAGAGDELLSKSMNPVTLRYSDPNLHFFKVEGKIEDLDSGSGPDNLWVANQNIDLLQIMASNAEFLVKGDRNSENADLYIRVTDGGEVF
ncbi:hypothetical protein B1R32_1036 [Abditibacterium utsteinense]|uniref:Uncharacterized protein n=1 Tax=Abditibacterium utsteinense TaxID=1960156 RepID=A0A2S8SVD1_9BACT|nr:hypothetical protein [Abditibacterium utsteinense]PQV64739.1 hypothetical protein B1R32_1036 [Abditibacterium utsteinense]